MENILIIKTNASGDVLRTTVLLHILKGRIFWITAAYNIPLFPDQYPNLTVVPVESIPEEIFTVTYELVVNLEEDAELARMVSDICSRRLIGVFWKNDRIEYSPESEIWFDMSRVSRLPAAVADKLKFENSSSYQTLIYGMLGKLFSGQEYVIHQNDRFTKNAQTIIGIEKRVGKTWPNKYWHGYAELIDMLRGSRYNIKIFEERHTLREYMEDIRECSLVISGDTLAMHIAIAYKVPCIAIFNCTSPDEIYDYGVLKKIISPRLLEAFYKQECLDEIINSIPVAQVYDEVIRQLPR